MPNPFENTSILIIDDTTAMLATTASVLQGFGFKHVYTASDPIEGYEKFCRYNPSIVVTDWAMEPMDGIELTQKIRTDPESPNKFVPVILMTGYSAKIRVIEARDKGVNEFIAKPFTTKDLIGRIESLLEKPRKFVNAKTFFGPDRRRTRTDNYDGPRRRGSEKGIQDILKDLQKEAQDKE